MPFSAPYSKVRATTEIIAIADASLGGLRGRSAVLIGPEELRHPYAVLLHQAGMKNIYQEEISTQVASIIPHIQLLISIPDSSHNPYTASSLNAATIAKGCIGRHTPLLIFDLADEATPSVEALAGLLPAVCLYTPTDLRYILTKVNRPLRLL